MALSYKFSKLETQYERDMYFSFDFGWYSTTHFDIVRWEQNPLSVAKVICRQSLNVCVETGKKLENIKSGCS